jgi:ubiquinone/menaquinone biosynthesis C-methylase UbiE
VIDFDRAAPRYDLMVALNPGYHRHLRSAACALLERLAGGSDPLDSLRLLDLGCGSGASTRALLGAAQTSRESAPTIVAVDASAGMLAQARRKVWPGGVCFHHGLVEDLSDGRASLGLTEPVDGVFAAYLFRNLLADDDGTGSARDRALRTVRDLLRPGGVLVVQEYSVSGSRTARLTWTSVCRLIVLPLSRLAGTDVALYEYLWRSVLGFDAVERFADRLWQAGFVDVEVRTVPGWQRGILHTFRARVP